MDQARAILAVLLAGGWKHAAIFRTPNYVLADWLRENGHDDMADKLADEYGEISRLRDVVYLSAPSSQWSSIREWVDEVITAKQKR